MITNIKGKNPATLSTATSTHILAITSELLDTWTRSHTKAEHTTLMLTRLKMENYLKEIKLFDFFYYVCILDNVVPQTQ